MPLRVLHVVGKMDRGGTETWLMHLLRRIDRAAVTFDFLVETEEPGAYDNEVLGLGSLIIRCERTRNLFSYWQRLIRCLTDCGPYDVVHSHVHLFSGVVLAAAAYQGVRGRVAHGHMDMRPAYATLDAARRVYYSSLRASLSYHMTRGIAVSEGAARDLFGAGFASRSNVCVRPCGIDYSAYASSISKAEVRTGLGIPHEASVVGHVGRFDAWKNHQFLVESFERAARRHPTLHLLLVGDGRTRGAVERQVASAGLHGRVTFAGLRSDVPDMLAAMDAFAFPSVTEGLGLALVEAQAAGLPCVISNAIPSDAIVGGHWVKRVSLDDPELWGNALLEAVNVSDQSPSIDQKFDIDRNLQELLTLYRSFEPAPLERVGVTWSVLDQSSV